MRQIVAASTLRRVKLAMKVRIYKSWNPRGQAIISSMTYSRTQSDVQNLNLKRIFSYFKSHTYAYDR